jgi:hypothetical protein
MPLAQRYVFSQAGGNDRNGHLSDDLISKLPPV